MAMTIGSRNGTEGNGSSNRNDGTIGSKGNGSDQDFTEMVRDVNTGPVHRNLDRTCVHISEIIF